MGFPLQCGNDGLNDVSPFLGGRRSIGPPGHQICLVKHGFDLHFEIRIEVYREVTVMGFSLGGAVAVALARAAPARVRRLVLVSPAGFAPRSRNCILCRGARRFRVFLGRFRVFRRRPPGRRCLY